LFSAKTCAVLVLSVLACYGQDRVVGHRAAARFLDQATFGADEAGISALRPIGFGTWLDNQLLAPLSPIPDAPPDARNLTTVQKNFFYNAMNGGDQLRQRVAFALGQIWVVSGTKVRRPEAFIPYLRLLQKDAFGNFYDLMRDVTLSPAMGYYLDMVNNDKPDPLLGREANENYARELLQLFTIGLNELNEDGMPRRDDNGQRIPTFDQDVVEGFARAFTGWTYPPTPGRRSRPHNRRYWEGEMVVFERNHDREPKPLLNGVVLPAGRTAEQDLDAALRNIFEHANVGPFIGKQMIQHLVTSNPSPEYVARVTAAFNDNGTGVRGDMAAVVRAILLDPEARQYDDAPPPAKHTFGHLREPVLFLTSLLRSLGADVEENNNLANLAAALGQRLYYPASVFNYFAPGNEIEGTGLLGPEFQLLSPANAIARVNLANRIFFGSVGRGTTLDLIRFYRAARDPEGLVELVNQTLMHGGMSGEVRASVLDAISAAQGNRPRARTALYLAASSGQYQVQQ